MNDASRERFNVSTADLRRCEWQLQIASSERAEVRSYYEIFRASADSCKKAGDNLGYRVFTLLYVVASFHPNFDVRGNPYGSLWTKSDGSRSLNAEDLSEADMLALGGIVEEIDDPEFRARVADVLWVTKKSFEAAKIAITAFLESAKRLKTDELWLLYAERLERAARISAIRGFETERVAVVAVLESAVVEFENNAKTGLLCHRLMSILLSLEHGDFARYAAVGERLARQFASADNWHFSEDYWQLAGQFHRRAKNCSEAQRCQIEAAECNVSSGECGLRNGCGAMFAAMWIGKGLEALRRAKADRKRIEAVHRRLLEVQEKIPTAMQATELAVDDIPGFRENEAVEQEASRKFVSGLEIRAALERFATVARPTKFQELKRQYFESSKEFSFFRLVTSASIDDAGKTTDVFPPLGTGTPQDQAAAELKHLYSEARTIHWQMPVAWRIEPARQAIMEEHSVHRKDLLFLVLDNPLIPEGPEGIYLRGIQAGFHGDWLAAIHLLIPQLEASIRHVLQKVGVVTSGLRDGVQAEKDLKQLMAMPEFEQIFGSDIAFDMRGILIDHFGHNLRNRLAHGLLPEGGFYQPASEYLWWLTIHLCWLGFCVIEKPIGPQPNPVR